MAWSFFDLFSQQRRSYVRVAGVFETGGLLAMRIKRVLATVGVVVAAGVTPLITASSASANTAQCSGIVKHYGYIVGPKVVGACSNPKLITGSPNPYCVYGLMQAGVSDSVAYKACDWA
ncbi:hypothetical protein [Streptomyces anandii]|uniref:hypothetical protein n=1 Tax=Streptomyces anandii TaxID=285454 RepID=UPI0036A344C4